jgi:CDP-diacylglycerol--glycerol-3-phosphate 3-phosphatidyltransferase
MNTEVSKGNLSEVPGWKMRLPTQITWFRIWMTIPIVACLYPDKTFWNIIAAILFIISSISDYFDGYFARKYNAISNMGKFLDPLADKILVTSILVMLIPTNKIDPLMVIAILTRDIFISGIRSIAAADGIIIAAKPTGKWKTALQMVAIPAVMIDDRVFGISFDLVGYWVLWLSVVLSITSGVQYYLGYLKGRPKP